MEEKKKKKVWTEPKLTALVRRKPEEGILLSCKSGEVSTGAKSYDLACFDEDRCDQGCAQPVDT